MKCQHSLEMADQAEWMLGFHNSDGKHRTDAGFPAFSRWNLGKEATAAEGRRVLEELIRSGDESEWIGFAFPQPFLVGSGSIPPDSWFLKSSDVR